MLPALLAVPVLAIYIAIGVLALYFILKNANTRTVLTYRNAVNMEYIEYGLAYIVVFLWPLAALFGLCFWVGDQAQNFIDRLDRRASPHVYESTKDIEYIEPSPYYALIMASRGVIAWWDDDERGDDGAVEALRDALKELDTLDT